MSRAILFRKCLGLNDARAFGTQKMITDPRDPEAGNVELIDCLNLTTTPDSCLEKLPPLVTVLDTGAPVTSLSSGSRCMFGDGTNIKEWTGGSTVVTRFPAQYGLTIHTPLDARVASGGKVYKSINPSGAMVEALVGSYTGPPVQKPFSAMPVFKQAFVYNAKLYAVNAADPRFIQYSEDYAYDLYNLADNSIGSALPVWESGAIPGVMLTTHDGGVTVYSGAGPHDFTKKFYPCNVIDKTLYSGFVSKVYGYSHIFLCDDGVYVVGPSGDLVNVTVDQTDHIDVLNDSYSCTTVLSGKYLAVGNRLGIEYDFKTKSLLKRSSFGIAAACVHNGVNYFAVGNTIAGLGSDIDSSGAYSCSMTLPYSDFSARGKKSIEALYFTGTIDGDVTITATDQTGNSWNKEISVELVNVSGYRITTPRGYLGNHISISIECTSGVFRLEELTASFNASSRTR
jgi:hypothetical protein